MAVFFDATGTTTTVTTRPFHDIEYRWDFGDAASGTWNAGSRPGVSSRNSTTGPVAAHVFESPGTYTVTLTAIGSITTVPSQIQITVQDPNVVFSGANTICFSKFGTFTGCPASATKITVATGDFAAAIKNNIGTGSKRFLFRAGETWTAAATATIGASKTGPGIVGSFGSGAAPHILVADGVEAIAPNSDDWRIMDLELDLQSSTTARGIRPTEYSKQITLLRLNIHNGDLGILISDPSATNWDQIAVVGCQMTTMSGNFAVLIASARLSFLGNNVGPMIGGVTKHVTRFPYIGQGVISNNTLTTATEGGHVIKLHAPNWSIYAAYTEQVVISDNVLTGSTSVPWTVSIGPQSGATDERVRNVIFERNWFIAGGGSTQTNIEISSTDITVRNNIADMTGGSATSLYGFEIVTRGIEPAPNNVSIYNNTYYASDAHGEFDIVLLDSTPTNTMVISNLGSAPNASVEKIVNGTGGGGLFQSNNLWNNSPGTLFVSATPTVPADFKLTAKSPAIDAGTAGPRFSDFFDLRRPNGSAIDIGATEF